MREQHVGSLGEPVPWKSIGKTGEGQGGLAKLNKKGKLRIIQKGLVPGGLWVFLCCITEL